MTRQRQVAGGVVFAVALGLTLALALAAYGSSSSSSTRSRASTASAIPAATINVVAADYGGGTSAMPGKVWWSRVVKAFNKTYPQIKVNMDVVNWNDVDNKITSEVQANNPPDIAQASADWTGLQSIVYPASQVLSPAAQNNMVKSFYNQGKIGTSVYGIPWIASSRALVYNQRLFSKAGIGTAPTTWAQYQRDAQSLKKAGVPTPACIPLGNEEAQAEALIWELGNGGGFVNSSGQWALNSPQNVNTFKFINSLVKAGVTNPNPATTNRTADCWAQFEAGKVGMTNSQPAELPGLAKSKVKYVFAPIPGRRGLAKTTLGVNDWIWAFKTKSDHQQQDKAFLDFVLSDKWQKDFFDQYKLLPITKGASKQIASANPALKPFLLSLPTDTFYPVNQKAWAAVNAKVKQIIGTAVSSNPKPVLDQLQQVAKQNS
jgi:multiple sugar transport system substrate-binding protein